MGIVGRCLNLLRIRHKIIMFQIVCNLGGKIHVVRCFRFQCGQQVNPGFLCAIQYTSLQQFCKSIQFFNSAATGQAFFQSRHAAV